MNRGELESAEPRRARVANLRARLAIALMTMLHRPRTVIVSGGTLAGLRLRLDTRRGAEWTREMAAGRYDSWLADIAGAAPPRVAWDVGAHIGYHSLALAAAGAGRVEAFEPNRANLRRLRQHLRLNPSLAPRVSARAFALADRDGPNGFLFHRDVDGGRSSVGRLDRAAPLYPALHYLGFSRRRVACRSGDSLVFIDGWPAPEFVKIDVEGAELRVLQGMRILLETRRPVLCVELHGDDLRRQAAELLEAAGYRLWWLAEAPGPVRRVFLHAQPRKEPE